MSCLSCSHSIATLHKGTPSCVKRELYCRHGVPRIPNMSASNPRDPPSLILDGARESEQTRSALIANESNT